MKAAIILLLALTILVNCDNDSKETISSNSIGAFINYLKESGFYGIIYELKTTLGNEAAYFTCEEFLENTYCEEVVRVYMISSSKIRQLASIILQKLIEILFKEDNLIILKKNGFDELTIKQKILRIEKRFQKS